MKCLRCGKEFKDSNRKICDECGYNFKEGERLNKILNVKKDPDVPQNKKTDLVDYPILSFIFGVLGIILPIGVFSGLAIHLSKKPSKASLIPFANVGYVFGIVGIGLSVLFAVVAVLFLL